MSYIFKKIPSYLGVLSWNINKQVPLLSPSSLSYLPIPSPRYIGTSGRNLPRGAIPPTIHPPPPPPTFISCIHRKYIFGVTVHFTSPIFTFTIYAFPSAYCLISVTFLLSYLLAFFFRLSPSEQTVKEI